MVTIPVANGRSVLGVAGLRSVISAKRLVSSIEGEAISASPAQLVIRVTVRQCFFHRAKAFLRSQLWEPTSWGERISSSCAKYLAAKAGSGEEVARKIDQAVARDHKSNL